MPLLLLSNAIFPTDKIIVRRMRGLKISNAIKAYVVRIFIEEILSCE